MISKIIEFSVRNRFIVLLLVGAVSLLGLYCLYRTPVDAIPDLSENQVIVWADWSGRSPKEIEDQITYPLSVNLQGMAGVKAVRATSEFGFSMINVIFDDSIDFYFARQRVLERLSTAGMFLPMGVIPYMAPDATALGQIFWYTVEGEGRSLDDLRSIQDWTVRYPLNSVPGVAEVASVGGFVREYQVDVDPGKLRTLDISLGEVFRAVIASNSSVGGKVLHKGGSEYLVRGVGWLRSVDDLRDVVITERKGIPITVESVGSVQLGPAFRRGVLEKDGREAVGGVVMMRHGENPLAVTQRVKEKIQKLQPQLPKGVRIVPFYDRTALIEASIGTLRHTLTEEIVIASIVVVLVLWHFRSAIVICITLPLAVLISFIFMYLFKIPSNIMSLSGIAISIGVLIDAGIVMTENAYHRLRDRFGTRKVTGDTRDLVIEACKVVGGPLFFSIVIMLLSFAPIFVLGGMEGRMFNPLAYTKSFALVGVAALAITLVPALIPTFVRGRLRSQEEVWLVRSFVNIYRPMLDYFLRHPDVIVVITGLFMVVSLPLFPRDHGLWPKVPWRFFVLLVPFILGTTALFVAKRKVACLAILGIAAVASYRWIRPLGEEFMPPLNEMALMDMPTSRPNINITQAGDDIKARNAILREFPEIHQVVGKVGRAETSTDPAPVDMVETIVSLRPEAWWPRRKVRYDDALAEARAVRALLEGRGLLRAREMRRNDQRATAEAAAGALERLAGLAVEAKEIELGEAAGDGSTAWSDLASKGAVEARDGQALSNAGAIYAAALKSRRPPKGKIPRAEAYRQAASILRGDLKGAIERVLDEEDRDLAAAVTMDALSRLDRALRELSKRRLRENVDEKGRALARLIRRETVSFLKSKGLRSPDLPDLEWAAFDDRIVRFYARDFDEWILLEDVTRAVDRVVDFLRQKGAVEKTPGLLARPESLLSSVLDPLRSVAGRERPTFAQELWEKLEEETDRLMRARVKQLDGELQDRAPGMLASLLVDETEAKARERKLLAREGTAEERDRAKEERARAFAKATFLWKKTQDDVRSELDSELQVPGWGNIWTRPIQNRVDMLSTGVRTSVGVKITGNDSDPDRLFATLQRLGDDIKKVLLQVRGAADVTAEPVTGENYLQITIDRKKAARYGVSVQAIQDVIEVALGGKEVTTAIEGAARYPVRVRYPREHRADEERVRDMLVPVSVGASGGGMEMAAAAPMAAGRLQQVPLSQVAEVRIVPGPSMIRSENGLRRSYVYLNVRDRDLVGFVEEARQAVLSQVNFPEGYTVDWTGQFEHQVNAQRTLTLVFPVVILVIFVILYLTYRDFADTLMMFLAVPGAIAGGAIFQWILPKVFGLDTSGDFSVAVWVGYVACFGLATETGIVMLVYLREAIDRRGGMERIASEAAIREAVMEGAVARLRPKLLTEGTTILALIPMLWATGVGAEFMKPMAVPILGGILVADEVIDILIPVLFYRDRCRRLKNRMRETPAAPASV